MKKILFLLLFTLLFFTACESKNIIDGVDLSDFTKTEVTLNVNFKPEREESLEIEGVELNESDSIYLVIDESIYTGTFIAVVAGNTIFSIEELIGDDEWSDADLDNMINAYYN